MAWHILLSFYEESNIYGIPKTDSIKREMKGWMNMPQSHYFDYFKAKTYAVTFDTPRSVVRRNIRFSDYKKNGGRGGSILRK